MNLEKRGTAKIETLLPGMKGIKGLTRPGIRFIVTAIIFVSIFGGIWYTLLYGFDVERIEFSGEGMQAEFNERLITGNIIFFPSEKVRQDLLAEYPQLEDVVIKKQFPHTITIVPVLRKPYAILVTAKASYGIDKEGNVLRLESNAPGLPEIRMDIPTVRLGATIQDPRLAYVLLYYSKITSLLPVTSIQTSDDGLSFRAVSDKTDILFTQDQPIDTLIATLQTIITGVRMKGTMPKIIDSRFTKPVIQWN